MLSIIGRAAPGSQDQFNFRGIIDYNFNDRAPRLALAQARLRQFDEGAGTVRQALAFRRQAVVLLGAHLAEGAIEAVRLKQRVIAEAFVATRWPNRHAV